MSEKIRVLIADDHAIIRDGLKAILDAQPDIEVVAEATEGQQAAQQTSQMRPDIVIMDVTMPGTNGLEATRLIKSANPDVRVLVLTMHDNDQYFFQTLQAGASGYFVKGGSSNELVGAIRTVYQGEVFLYPSMAKRLLNDYVKKLRSGPDRDGVDNLTDREREVLKLVAEGYTNQEIAESLVVSTNTVQTHRGRIMSKLGLHSRTELVRFAIKQGIVALDK